MAQDTKAGASKSDAADSAGRKTRGDGDPVTSADFSASDAADFQVSLATATSMAGLTAYASPVPELSAYVSDDAILAETTLPAPLPDQMSGTTLHAKLPNHKDVEPGLADAVSPSLSVPHNSAAPEPHTPAATIDLNAQIATSSSKHSTVSDELPDTLVTKQIGTSPAQSDETTEDVKEVWAPEAILSSSMAENAEAGSPILSLPILDQYGAPIAYELADALGHPVSDSPFAIVDGVLVLSDGSGLDFESDPQLDIFVTATNEGGTSGPWPISVTITDVAEEITLDDGGETFTDTGVAETSITGGSGDDVITAHDDGGLIDGAAGGDTLIGGAGDDTMSGGAGADTILGHGGHDHLDGGSDDDMILGGSGNDTLHGGIGDDTIDGGDNADTAVFTGAWSDYTITETGGIYTVADNRPDSPDGTDTLTNVELFHFADGSVAPADALNGGPRVNATNGTVTENDAGAVIGAVSGTDPDAGDSVTLSVDDARFEIVDDQLKLKTGESLDYEDGATVNVTVTATDLHGATDTQVVTVTVGDLGETITLDDGGETFTDTGVAETSITGGSGDDVITAHDDGGLIDGAAGGDTLIGGAGDDTMSGGAGADVLDGGSGYDTAIWDGDLADFDIAYDANTQTFKISDQNTSDDDEGTDFVTNVETFNFNGTTHTAAEMIAEAGRQANEAPTDISFSAVGDLRGGASTIEETVVTGEIQETGTYTTVDHWEITHNGGDLTIDVLTKGTEYEGLDSRVRLFLDNGDGTFTQIAENDDGAAGSDGSTSSYDSLISATDLSAGTYVLAIGSYPMSERQAIRTDTDYSQTSGTGGAYQITFTGNAAVEVAENPTYGGAWGDPTDVGTVARTTHETSGFERGTPVARVSSVRDANEGDTHSYALSNDADGTFAIDANSGAISLTADPRDEGTSQDTITVVATDQYGESHNETISLTFGNNADNSLLGTENNDIIYGFDGENTLQGGAGNDTIVGGVSDSLAVESIVADNGTNVHGTTGRDFYSWTAETGESATIRFNYSPSSANDGDGVFDYVVVETTEGDTKLTIGDFDIGVDQVVLQEAYESISVYGFSNGAVYDVTYRNGNTQTFTIYGVDGASAPEDIFTTVMPDTEYSGGDTAVYSGDASDFDVTYDAATGAFVIIDQNTRDGLDEGTDVVTGVETFSFNGVEISASDLMGTDTTPTENPDFDTAERDATHAGDSGNNAIWATSSDDVIYGLAGNDTVGGQAGDDVVYGGSGNDQLHGNDGADTLYGGSGDDVAYAHTGNDVVYDDGGNDTLHGIEGEDTVFGGSGEDLIYGGDDADQLFGNADTDKIHGEAGNDTIVGGTGADVLHGGRDDDPISGGSGNDSLVGDSGNDTFSYAALGGADTINGGSGWTDVIELAGFGGNVTIEDSTVEGYGWTLVFDQDYTATAETLNSLDLGSDASGVITFDDGGTIDFTGIDKINF